ncbi:MAG: hypothetical protein QOJ53_195 [Sphingomonadales bacterium]|jgi:hypothetical protein|nr:hypothetical protein [Sphingomonadales bacterium]
MTDRSTCPSPLCGITVEGSLKKCPQCGWAMRGTRNIRARGWALLVCGLFLLGLMGSITWTMLPTLLYPERAFVEGTYTGTPEQAHTFLNLFLLVLLFGALGTVNALYMIATGRQNRWFVIGTLLLAAILYGFAYSITGGFK